MAKRTRDADEMKKRKMARLRFRNLIRSVSLNRIWLEDLVEQKLSLNVKKNIAMLVRTKRKIGLLTMAEKSLIRSNHVFRTIEDRKKLVSLMASLTCFHKISPKIRSRLVKCIKFMIISPGRKLIKEGDLPLMVYFLLTGEVEVTKKVYDHIKNIWVDKIEMICGPGDCLGDVEMIERCTRRHTYTTTNVVELLVVFEEDFENVLRPVMEKQWTEKQCAIMSLDYFNFFTKDQIINTCKLCVLRQFEPLETIYYEDKGQLSYVHFVISGECMILQCLKMMVSQNKGVKTFELTDITKDDASSMFQDLTNTELLRILREENNSANKTAFDIDKLIASEEDENFEKSSKSIDMKKMDLKSIEIKCGILQTKKDDNEYSTLSTTTTSFESESSEDIDEQEIDNNYRDLQKLTNDEAESYMPEFEMEEEEGDDNYEGEDEDDDEDIANKNPLLVNKKPPKVMQAKIAARNIKLATGSFENEHPQMEQVHQKHKKKNKKSEKIHSADRKVDTETKRQSLEAERNSTRVSTAITLQSIRQSIRNSLSIYNADNQLSKVNKPKTGVLENHFIDVGSLTFGSIFGLGEKLEHRVIMARTTVQCLMIPRFWIFEKEQNPGNIWQRRRFYLDSTIPSRQTLFNDFLTTRQWQKFKKDLITSNLNPNSISNSTRVQDVPIICRIVEASED